MSSTPQRHRSLARLAGLTFLAVAGFRGIGLAQSTMQATGGFTPGSREIFKLDLASTPAGGFPASLKALKGKIAVAMKDGVPMLKAAEPAEFLVQLGENLPDAFTVEFELTPKACCQPEDISFEGTPAISRSPNSMHVVWDRETMIAVGGGEYVQRPMPGDLKEILPSNPTKVQASFDGTSFRLFTNGRLVLDLPNRKFAHGRVLRVFLGGQDDDQHAVYLAALRIATGGGAIANQDVTPRPFTVTVTNSSAGPVVTWPPVAQASGYTVTRWKIDDVTCCNNSSGRTYLPGSPWQDKPLPVSGTYVYRVGANTPAGQLSAETQFGFRKPEGGVIATAPVTAVLVDPVTTGTITPVQPVQTAVTTIAPTPGGTVTPTAAGTSPLPSGGTSGTLVTEPRPTSVTPLSTAPAATNFSPVNGTPTTTQFKWDLAPNATSYGLRRALAGTTTWTNLTPTPLAPPASTLIGAGSTFISNLVDTIPDPRQTYTYQLSAYQADGTYGLSTTNFAPPAPADPTNFTAVATAANEVQLTWTPAPFAAQYLITGPGVGSGVTVAGTPCCQPAKLAYAVKQLPPGTHSWTIASSYQPGGVLTVNSAWPTATASLGTTSGKYIISVGSVRSNIDSRDDIANIDGVGNEIFVNALVQLLDNPLKLLSDTMVWSAIHGDVTSFAPPARVRAGSATVNGGIAGGDVISPIWNQPDAASKGYTPLVLWQGTLTDGKESVKIVPAIWEWSNGSGDSRSALWAKLLRSDAAPLDLAQRTSDGDIANVMRYEPRTFSGIVRGVWSTNVLDTRDRPIGVARDTVFMTFPDLGDADYFPIYIQVTRTVAEAALSGAYGPPGIIPIRFVDHQVGSKSTKTRPEFGFGDYTLNIRIERIP